MLERGRTAARRLSRGTLSLVVGAVAMLAVFAAAAPSAPTASPEALEVRSIVTSELGLARPAGLAYVPADAALVVAGDGQGETSLLRMSLLEDVLGSASLPQVSSATVAFDRSGARLTALSGTERLALSVGELRKRSPSTSREKLPDLGLVEAGGATFLPDGTWVVLDTRDSALVRLRPGARNAVRAALSGLGSGLRGLAYNPADGLLYVAAPAQETLYAGDGEGTLRKSFGLAALEVEDLRALVFAPSADPTDDPAEQHLFVADAGSGSVPGRVLEVSLAPAVVVAAPIVVPTLLQTIDTSLFAPPSPDPAGLTYVPATDRLLITDSEVDEMSIYQGANLYEFTRLGALVRTGTTVPFTPEPTGAGYGAANSSLYVTDDDQNSVFVVRAGGDGGLGTSDDLVTEVSTATFGSLDPEGTELDPDTGHLLISDGVGIEVYDVDPVNGVFGDGNDAVTSFDAEVGGVRDAEGIGFDPQRHTYLVIDPLGGEIYEFTKSGTLVRVIDLSVAIPSSTELFAGVAVAPTSNPSDSPTAMSYWVCDRQVDNNSNPNENDGKVYELSIPADDALPSVLVGAPAAGTTVEETVQVTASAWDDQGVTQVQFFVDGTSIGTDTNGADGWSASWNTRNGAKGTTEGAHTVTATATDSGAQTSSDANVVTVANTRQPVPSAPQVVTPASGSTVSGIVPVTASTSGPGIARVEFFADGRSIGTDTVGADGWSASWDTSGVANGSHTLAATATDTAGRTATGTSSVTVANPEILSLTIPIRTGADDAEQRSDGRILLRDGDLDLVVDKRSTQTVALRFAGVPIPARATIVSAHLQLRADSTSSGRARLTLRGQRADDAAALSGRRRDIAARPRTGAAVTWTPLPWSVVGEAGSRQRSPDLSAIVQEIVDRPGWASGNALVLVVTGSGKRAAESFEGGSPPVLEISYRTG
jgi:hypothetical protein